MAVNKLPVGSCPIDGEAIVCNHKGLSVFELIRGYGSKASAVPRIRSARTQRRGFAAPATRVAQGVLNGERVFRAACKLGCEGIVLKRLGSMYRSGRSPHWVKVKNPKVPAVKGEAEEDWEKR